MTQLVPVQLFEKGYADLISVVPPGVTLSPGSKLAANSLGKAPGIKYSNGTWGGYNWRAHAATATDVQKWALDGANIGLRAGRFPGLDIDSMNAAVVDAVKQMAFEVLGPAPVRVGKAPKALLMYRTAAPFTRMRMWLEGESETHLIELLGEGQQYLVFGTHPGTMRPYSWNQEVPSADQLHEVSAAKIELLFGKIKQHFGDLGFTVRREGDGRKQERTGTSDQAGLRAPSIEALATAVTAIPNGSMFETREQWVRMGAAIRAACGDELEEGFNIWAEWCSRWDGGTNDDDYVRQNWRRLYPPFAIGWGWIEETARGFGYNAAPDEFPAEGEAPDDRLLDSEQTEESKRVRLSDAWLADKVVTTIGDRLRYVPATGRWLAWNGARWEPDGLLLAQSEIARVLHAVAKEELTRDYKGVEKEARRIEAAHTLFAVMSLVKADRSIAVDISALDADPWVLNTPSGVVDLKTGELRPGVPEQLLTKTTKVGPAPAQSLLWNRFLRETTGGDEAMVEYLQRLAGYCLTGLTVEQTLGFIWGPGGNGKSVFLTVLREVLGDYATVASMDVFTASKMERHSTDLADMMGARLVVASETQKGREWDEQKLKMLSAGDAVKARFMRQDNVMYRPAFKLLFAGNHQPHIKSLDDAMRRRIHMIPFNRKPEKVDLFLGEKLREEYPAIMSWMLFGCAKWQKEGLQPPEAVLLQTQEYFEGEDLIGRWIADRLSAVEDAEVSGQDLFESFREWCGETGERPGRINDLTQALRARGYVPHKHPRTRRSIYRGLQIDTTAAFGEEPLT